jgi:hypothetical protein
MTEIISLKRKFVNSTLINKTCKICHKEYPRTQEFFYARKSHSRNDILVYDKMCIRCDNERSLKWKRKNKEYVKLDAYRYKSTEKGYFKELWQGVKKSKHGSDLKDFDEFFNCWKEQEKIYGIKCPYTGIEMTRIKGINKGEIKKKTTETNISKDRILSSKPYSKENIMFVSWKVNSMKGNISPKIAKKYLQFVKERFGTDEIF